MANLELQASAGFCCIDDVIHAGDYFAVFPLEAVMVVPADRFFTECRRRVWLPLCILIRCCCCDKKKPQVAVPASGATCVVNYRSKVRLGASINSQELGFVSEGEVVTLIETKITYII